MTTTRIQKILFPVNFSPSCIAMAPYVLRAATLFNAVVSLVHVVDPAELDLFEQYELYVRPVADILEDQGRSKGKVRCLSNFGVPTCRFASSSALRRSRFTDFRTRKE